jgi:BASS family bile acid:Na+ symporter
LDWCKKERYPVLDRLVGTSTKLFPLWSLLVGGVALYSPESFLWYGKDAIGYGLAIIMLGMGMTLEVQDFLKIWKKPKIVGFGVFAQYLIMPAWGSLLVWVFELPDELAVGLILVSCCPGGTASNVVVFLARADVALSVSLTTFSTLCAVIFTPWLTGLYAGRYVPVDSFALLKSICMVVILPVFIGLLWKRYFKKSALGISRISPLISVIFILLIVGFVLAAKKSIIINHWSTLLTIVLLLHTGGFLLGYLTAVGLKLNQSACRTFSIEIGMQNSGLGMALASKHFAHYQMASAPCALSAVIHCIIGSTLAAIWGYRESKSSVNE